MTMIGKVQVGDLLRCVRDNSYTDVVTEKVHWIRAGEVYTVSAVRTALEQLTISTRAQNPGMPVHVAGALVLTMMALDTDDPPLRPDTQAFAIDVAREGKTERMWSTELDDDYEVVR